MTPTLFEVVNKNALFNTLRENCEFVFEDWDCDYGISSSDVSDVIHSAIREHVLKGTLITEHGWKTTMEERSALRTFVYAQINELVGA